VCRVRHLSLYVPSELHEQVQKAATAAGVKGAQWLRHMVRQITITDFPATRQAATPRERFHDSRTHTERFMLRLDEPSQTKLQQLIKEFGTSKAAIIRFRKPYDTQRSKDPRDHSPCHAHPRRTDRCRHVYQRVALRSLPSPTRRSGRHSIALDQRPLENVRHGTIPGSPDPVSLFKKNHYHSNT
jgi:hypothetical protein